MATPARPNDAAPAAGAAGAAAVTTSTMKEHPILFSAPMILAILAGTKTQTRRIIRMRDGSLMRDEDLSVDGRTVMDFTKHYPHWQQLHSPFGKPGDRLWVRETCRAEELSDGTWGVRYLADNHFERIGDTEEDAEAWRKLHYYGNRCGATVPPIHAPRWTSRILLEKVAGRVEQLKSISYTDAHAEGAGEGPRNGPGGWGWKIDQYGNVQSRAAFAALWESIHGPGSWEANPWLWVEEFKRIQS